ncbi:MAG: SprB repeat-containing protein, partial [Dinghuibacter sp.]|nr:SprB repeat-containing protein [Dinghuibacter sp.]
MIKYLPAKTLAAVLFILNMAGNAVAQTYNPVTVTGFNHDVVAETGTSSLTSTTFPLDGVTQSNKVMYTQLFRTNVGFSGGGLPNNGAISNATGNYQMAAFNANNALIVQRGQNADLNLASPAQFSALRILAFSTEGSSLLNIRLFYTDGTSANAVNNYSLGDWFNNNTNLVLSGFGRCTRSTPASGADAFPGNPRMYYIQVNIPCADRQKLVQKINFANATTAGTNAPYPNAVFLGVSGVAYTQNIQTSTTSATCSGNGTATATVTGSSGPYTISWNSSPAQTGPTATNLPAGNYTATVTDAGGCVTTASVTVALQNNLTVSSRNDTAICFGASFSPNLTSNATTFSWQPATGVSNTQILNPVLSPTATTTYTLTATQGPCTATRSFTVNVAQALSLNAGNDVAIFGGQTAQLNAVGPAGTYLWSPAAGLSATNIPNPVAQPTVTTTYTVRVTTAQGCTTTDDVKVTVIPYCVKVMEAFT